MLVFFNLKLNNDMTNITTANGLSSESKGEAREEIFWSYAQVAGKLYNISEKDYEIIVDNISFIDDKDVMEKQHLIRSNARYKEDISINGKGNITKIEFTASYIP